MLTNAETGGFIPFSFLFSLIPAIFMFIAVIMIIVFLVRRNKNITTGGGKTYFNTVDAKTAELTKKAEAGDAEAQYELAKKLYFSNGEKALYWYKEAARQGHVQAAAEVGNCYNYGRSFGGLSVTKDTDEAAKWYIIAAEAGDIETQITLGLLYSIKNDSENALRWYKTAAETGNAEAQHRLGEQYEYDCDNEEEAEKWYILSAEQGYVDAQLSLASLYQHTDNEQMRDAEKAFNWLKKAAESGESSAINLLASCYVKGRGTRVDYAEAARLYKINADKGEYWGMCELGKLYLDGNGVEKDEKKGIELLKGSAGQNWSAAKYELGLCYLEGKGVKKDEKRAFELISEVASKKFAFKEKYKLGELYYFGKGTKENKEAAREQWIEAAKAGFVDAIDCMKIYFGETIVPEEDY